MRPAWVGADQPLGASGARSAAAGAALAARSCRRERHVRLAAGRRRAVAAAALARVQPGGIRHLGLTVAGALAVTLRRHELAARTALAGGGVGLIEVLLAGTAGGATL